MKIRFMGDYRVKSPPSLTAVEVACAPSSHFHKRLLRGVLVATLLGVSHVATAESAEAGQPHSESGTWLYIALHLQHHTGMCGDAYAAIDAHRKSSICLHQALPLSGESAGKHGVNPVIALSQGMP